MMKPLYSLGNDDVFAAVVVAVVVDVVFVVVEYSSVVV